MYYKQIFIKDEYDLQKGEFFAHLKTGVIELCVFNEYSDFRAERTSWWMDNIDWYLIEQPEPEMTEKEIKDLLQHYEIYKAVNGLNYSDITYEQIIDLYLNDKVK